MSWIIGGNYANRCYAGLAHTDMATKAVAESLNYAFLFRACEQTSEGEMPTEENGDRKGEI